MVTVVTVCRSRVVYPGVVYRAVYTGPGSLSCTPPWVHLPSYTAPAVIIPAGWPRVAQEESVRLRYVRKPG